MNKEEKEMLLKSLKKDNDRSTITVVVATLLASVFIAGVVYGYFNIAW